jgi:multiple antibiotic resistance protein
MASWTEYSRFLIGLFAILTPFAAMPIFINLTHAMAPHDRSRVLRAAVATVLVVLVVAALAGEVLLRLLGTSLASFRVGGGIVLLLMALSMLSARVSGVQQTQEEADEAARRDAIGVVPLGLPLLAGPGAISTVIIEMQRPAADPWLHGAAVLACIVLVCAGVWLLLSLAQPIGERLGRTGLNILNRLFGLLLAAIAIETIGAGLRVLLPGLAQ